MDEKQDMEFMKNALRLAEKGAGWVAPNPMVGAILVRDGVVIGQGAHEKFGENHAEINALENCRKNGNSPAGALLYVNLEPCCHQGKTPPCTGAIVGAGIRRVVIATLDVNPAVAGKGVEQLRSSGISVGVGCCEPEARRLNAGFFKLQQSGRPLVILKWAQSLDGKLAWPKNSGNRWISGEKARQHVHRIRSRCGAVLVGINTVLADDPLLNVRDVPNAAQPLRVVLDSGLRTPMESQLVQTVPGFPLLIATSEAGALRGVKPHPNESSKSGMIGQFEERGCEVKTLPAGAGGILLTSVLEDLGRRGVTELLIEGGPTIHSAFLSQGLADRLMIYISPKVIGDVYGMSPVRFSEPISTCHVRHTALDDDLLFEADC
jgi:diaminohydroxyphosphoribosylaminopyrimidine deaminase/5-amino-6-(5-phosphoribosylamino)uracil reductase